MKFNFEKYGLQLMGYLEAALPKLIGTILILAIGWWLSNQLVRLMYRAMSLYHCKYAASNAYFVHIPIVISLILLYTKI